MEIDDYSFRLTIPTTYIPKYLGDIQSFLSGGSNFKVTGDHESESEENEDDEAEFFPDGVAKIDNEEKKQSEIDRLKQVE